MPSPSHPLLNEILRTVARRYRLPPMAVTSADNQSANPATTLAIVIEEARQVVAGGQVPDAALKRRFIEALSNMIRDAMRADAGDPAFHAIVLRHRLARVREFASLSAHADQDRRSVRSAINAVAHPGKHRRMPPGPRREALARLHAYAESASWSQLADKARHLLIVPEVANESSLKGALTRLLESPALGRLVRLEALASDESVRRYQSLWDRNGPRSKSPGAIAQGSAAQRRGAAVEALAAQALGALARRLEQVEEGRASYCVVTSMRVPASIPASHERAKSEWDAVLLRSTETTNALPVWDVCLLMEAKASGEAATTDFSRLLRGLWLLRQAEEDVVYSFKTRQGMVRLRGTSLRALRVLYCCDAPVEGAPRLLGAASRMQLLSARASVEFASALAEERYADSQDLEFVWHQLLESPRWGAVLRQYPTLRQVRELMVHPDDLLAAIDGTTACEQGSPA